jgi:hypothetical protein
MDGIDVAVGLGASVAVFVRLAVGVGGPAIVGDAVWVKAGVSPGGPPARMTTGKK